jgi:hypothetical protein
MKNHRFPWTAKQKNGILCASSLHAALPDQVLAARRDESDTKYATVV